MVPKVDLVYYCITGTEGLGTLYERFVFRTLLLRICREFKVKTLLEYPIDRSNGQPGVMGLSIFNLKCDFYICGCETTLTRLVSAIWRKSSIYYKSNIFVHDLNNTMLPIRDSSIDLVFTIATLHKKPLLKLMRILYEMCRICRKVILIAEPNIYYIFDKVFKRETYNDFLKVFDKILNRIFIDNSFIKYESGYIDIPPWPHITLRKVRISRPILELIDKLKVMNSGSLLRVVNLPEFYNCLIDYRNYSRISNMINSFKILEKSRIELLKKYLAHMRYWVYVKRERA